MKTIANKYRIIRKIGSGGFGEVHLAEVVGSYGFKRKIALKILPGTMMAMSGTREAFIREARILSTISHPNLVKVFDFGEAEGKLFLCMEFIEGYSLRDTLKAANLWGENLPLEIAVKTFEGILEGLSYLHGRDIVHGDLSPRNIMVGKNGEVKILDFGVSRILQDARGEKALGGKPAYRAPETARDGIINASSDIYSLGVILREMLEGIHGFSEGEGDTGEVSERISQLALACLDEEGERRPTSSGLYDEWKGVRMSLDSGYEIEEYLEGIEVEGDTVVERDVGSGGPSRLPLRVIFILCLLVGGGFITFLLTREVPTVKVAAPQDDNPKNAVHSRIKEKLPSYFEVGSYPEGATVYLDGKKSGNTPLKVTRGKSGIDRVVKVRVVKEGFRPFEGTLNGEKKGDQSFFAMLTREMGLLRINVNPWANVAIDGKKRGTTPVVEREVTAGEHVVTLENGPLGVRVERRITVKGGKTTILIEDFLKKK